MGKIELLAPAGNMECLKAAVNAGCDAVYLGGNHFGARAFSKNFSREEIVQAINYCHLYGVKVYITVNTLIYDDEVEEFLRYIEFIHKNNVDAVLIQDLGMFDLVRKTYPELEIHASTQMHINNLDGVKLMEELGMKRIVLPRELSLEEIKEIKDNIISEPKRIYKEIKESLSMIRKILNKFKEYKNEPILTSTDNELAKDAFVVSITEGWRGEVVHIAMTDGEGRLSKYKIKDPSFNNWYGLALAVRNNGVSDFPLCNKSFNLSYSGNDL